MNLNRIRLCGKNMEKELSNMDVALFALCKKGASELIDAYFSLKNKHPFVHGMRDEWVKNDWRLSQIWSDYRELKEYRQKASYKIYEFNSQEIKNDILSLLSSIKEFLQKISLS